MKYYIDTEFDGFGGPLLSMALVSPKKSLYIVHARANAPAKDPWVEENVRPHMYLQNVPTNDGYDDMKITAKIASKDQDIPIILGQFFLREPHIEIVADWPDDIKYFCESIITGPGMMIGLQNIKFTMTRVDAWPNDIPDAVQHNAFWDAYALMQLCKRYEEYR